MNTTLLYLEDTYLLKEKAQIVDTGQDEKGSFIILDKTIFYPQGGGQESDKGEIRLATGESAIIHFVRFEHGVVYHYTESDLSNFKKEVEVNLFVNKEHRLKCAALHSAGHLICGLALELASNLAPMKGYHFSNGSYVEFVGTITDTAFLMKALRQKTDEVIAADCEIATEIVSFETLVSKCKHIPSGLPQDKPLRIVSIGDLDPLPCGGTHLKNTNELKKAVIRKIKSSKGMTKISYEIEV